MAHRPQMVSVPFSDHAALLVNEADDLESLLSHLRERADKENCRYVEIRPVTYRNCRSDVPGE